MKFFNKEKSLKQLAAILALTFFVGIVAVLSAMIFVVYSGGSIISPFSPDVNTNEYQGSGQTVIIRGARDIVVEQEKQINNDAVNVKKSIAGIFKLKNLPKENAVFNITDYYNINESLAQAAVLTNDGWLIADLSAIAGGADFQIKNFVVITSDRKIYTIEKAIYDNATKLYFLQVKARDLSALALSSYGDVAAGSLVFSLNWQGNIIPTYVNQENKDKNLAINLANPIQIAISNDKLNNSFIFRPGGSLAGISNSRGEIIHSANITPALNSILKTGAIKRINFGANFVDLSRIAGFQQKNGAMIVKGSAAEAVAKNSSAYIAGLKEGDVIISLDGVALDENNTLFKNLNKYLPQDKVIFGYFRGGEKKETEVKF